MSVVESCKSQQGDGVSEQFIINDTNHVLIGFLNQFTYLPELFYRESWKIH